MRWLWAALLVACGGTNGTDSVSAADSSEAYVADVHPILERRCSTLDCHGDPGRPLRLYAETGLRAADSLRGQPITVDELAANVRSLLAVDPETPPAQSMLLTKPLAGGIDHVGGDIWVNVDEPQPACFLGWLTGKSADPTVAAACRTAAAEVMLPPP
jgi:hypothetical protein